MFLFLIIDLVLLIVTCLCYAAYSGMKLRYKKLQRHYDILEKELEEAKEEYESLRKDFDAIIEENIEFKNQLNAYS